MPTPTIHCNQNTLRFLEAVRETLIRADNDKRLPVQSQRPSTNTNHHLAKAGSSRTPLNFATFPSTVPPPSSADEVIDLIDDDGDIEITPLSAKPSAVVLQNSPNSPQPHLHANDDHDDFAAPLAARLEQNIPPRNALPRLSKFNVIQDSDDENLSVPLAKEIQPEKEKSPSRSHVGADTENKHDNNTVRESRGTKPKARNNIKGKKRESEENADDGKPNKRVKETRGAMYRSAPSRDVLSRMSRMNIRLCLVDKKVTDEALEYRILGSNGNLYKTTIALAPTCDCPDFKKRMGGNKEGPCKHLIFVFLRVLKLEREDPRWWQKRLVPSEFQALREKEPEMDENIMAESRVIDRFRASQDQEEEDCPICLEELGNEQKSRCRRCCKAFHASCLRNWQNARQSIGESSVTCPNCRAEMSIEESQGEQYDNLAEFSSQHERHLTLEELYAETHHYIGRGGRMATSRGRGGGRGSRGQGRKHGR